MSDLETRVQQALAEVRVYINQDGGDVEFVKIEDRKLFIKLTGACKGCPLSFFTLTAGVEDTVQRYAPEIEEVVSVEEDE